MGPRGDATKPWAAARGARARGSARLLGTLTIAGGAWFVAYSVLERAAGILAHDLLGLSDATAVGRAVAFFAYEAPKVLLLLVAVVFGVGIVRSFFTPERTRALLAGRREVVGNVLAGALGVVTPFCSCSAVPLFLGFVEVGIPIGVTLSFLVSAPMVNEVALVLLFGLLGWRVIALSLPEMIILRKVLKTELIATFAAVVAAGIMIVGWIFNAVL